MLHSQALQAGKALKGYSGPQTAPDVFKYLKDNKVSLTLGDRVVDWEKETLDADPVVHEPIKLEAAKAAAPVVDTAAQREAEIKEALKRLGVEPKTPERPNLTPEVVHVKSWQERLYEDNIKSGRAKFSSYAVAECFRLWMGAKMAAGSGQYALAIETEKKYQEFGERTKTLSSQSATGGAAFVPSVFYPELIRNVSEYGAIRKITRVLTTTAQEIVLPRRTAGNTMYYPAEGGSITTSDGTSDNIKLIAKTGAVLSYASRQVLDDSGISLVDLIMDDIALAVAAGEDDACFIGNGTGTYGNITGLARSFGTIATDGGYVVVGGATADVHTQANVVAAFARLPDYGRRNAVITCTPTMQAIIFERLSQSTPGGLLRTELVNDTIVQKFMGIPIITNNSMNSRIDASGGTQVPGFTSGDDIDFIIGNFPAASKLLDRAALEIEMDSSIAFDSYRVAFRAIRRFDFMAHDVGTSSAAGPIVSFWQT